MEIIRYIAGQFAKPDGIGGWISTFIMNRINKIQYKSITDNIKEDNISTKILDIGFGNGYLINKISKISSANLYGIEISKDMIIAATKRNKKSIKNNKVHLSFGNVDAIPFDDNFFDKIFTVNTIYFWKDPDSGLNEIKRVLKPGGIFINVAYTKSWLDKLRYTNYGFRKYEETELKEIFLRNGFKIEIKKLKENASFSIIAEK